MKNLLFILFIFLLLAGCISVGNKKVMDKTQREKIKIGQTMEEVKAIFGEPNMQAKDSYGNVSFIYSGGKSSAFGLGTKAASISITFDKNGKVTNIFEVQMGKPSKNKKPRPGRK